MEAVELVPLQSPLSGRTLKQEECLSSCAVLSTSAEQG